MKILIELPSWIGDAIMATPAIENLIKNYDKPDITIIGSSASIEILKKNPKFNKARVLEKNYLSIIRAAKDLENFELFISFRNSIRSKIFKFLVSSTKKFQFNKDNYTELHQVEKYNNFINDSLNQEFKAGKLTIKSDINFNLKNKKKVVGINPGASYGDAKQWIPAEFAKVASAISNQYDILIFGGPNDKKNADIIEKFLIKQGVTNYQNIAGRTAITELVNKISQLDLFLTGDSGPMHIAASFEIPTVSIFGPTKNSETSQWMNPKNIIVKKNLNCQPCMKRTCPLGHNNCMKLITSNDVLKAIDALNNELIMN